LARDTDKHCLLGRATSNNDLVIVNGLPDDLPVEDAELMLLEMHIDDIIATFANQSK